MTPLLETRGLSKTFGGLKAVQNVDLRVGANRIVSVIGPNGAGKTTFFNCLSGIYRPDGGAILIEGRDITGRAPHQVCKLGVSRTFQNIRLFPKCRCSKTSSSRSSSIARSPAAAPVALQTFLRSGKLSRDEALGFLDFVGLERHADAVSSNLAYGLQRRLEIARALATRPRILLLDERPPG